MEEQVRLGHRVRIGGEVGAGREDHASVGHHQVEPSVVVVVEEARAEAGQAEARLAEPAAGGGVEELALAVVAIERVGLAVELGDEEILVAVAVVVAVVDAHRRFGATVGGERAAGEQSAVGEATDRRCCSHSRFGIRSLATNRS